MAQPRWSLSVPQDGFTLAEHVALAREAEAWGYTDAWSFESDGLDCFSPLAVIGASTGLRLGTAIANVYTRGPATLAQSAAGVADVAPGRFILGLGSGSQVIIEKWNGGRFDKPATRVREMVLFLRQALTGERVVFKGKTFEVDGFRLTKPPSRPVPIYVAALRPGMLRVAGEVADGVILNWLAPEDVPKSVAVVREAAERAGRDPKSIEITARIFVNLDPVTPESETAVRRHVAGYLNVPVYRHFQEWLGRTEALIRNVARLGSGRPQGRPGRHPADPAGRPLHARPAARDPEAPAPLLRRGARDRLPRALDHGARSHAQAGHRARGAARHRVVGGGRWPAMTGPSIARGIIGQAQPILVGQLALMAYAVVDTVLTGHSSAVDLATMGLGLSVYSTVFVGLLGAVGALNPIIAQHYGAGRHAAIGATYVQGLWMALMLSALGVAVLAMSPLWLGWLQAPPEVEPQVTRYLRVLSLGLPGSLLFRAIYALNTAVSRPRVVMVMQLAGLGLKVLLSYALIYRRARAAAVGRGGRGRGLSGGVLDALSRGARLHATGSVLPSLLHPLGRPALAHPARALRARHPHEPLLHAGGDVLHRHHAARRAVRDHGHGGAPGGGEPRRRLLHDPAVLVHRHRDPHRPVHRRGRRGACAPHRPHRHADGRAGRRRHGGAALDPARKHRAALHGRPRGGGDGGRADSVPGRFHFFDALQTVATSCCARTGRARPDGGACGRALGDRRGRRLSGGVPRRLGGPVGDLGDVDDAGHRPRAGRGAPAVLYLWIVQRVAKTVVRPLRSNVST